MLSGFLEFTAIVGSHGRNRPFESARRIFLKAIGGRRESAIAEPIDTVMMQIPRVAVSFMWKGLAKGESHRSPIEDDESNGPSGHFLRVRGNRPQYAAWIPRSMKDSWEPGNASS